MLKLTLNKENKKQNISPNNFGLKMCLEFFVVADSFIFG